MEGRGEQHLPCRDDFFEQYEKEEKAKAKAKSKEVKATEANNKKEKKAQGEELIKKILDTQLPTVNGTVPVYDDCNDVRKKITEWYAVGITRNKHSLHHSCFSMPSMRFRYASTRNCGAVQPKRDVASQALDRIFDAVAASLRPQAGRPETGRELHEPGTLVKWLNPCEIIGARRQRMRV